MSEPVVGDIVDWITAGSRLKSYRLVDIDSRNQVIVLQELYLKEIHLPIGCLQLLKRSPTSD